MKIAEIRGLTLQELKTTIDEEQMKQKKVKLNHAVSPIENPMLIRTNRRILARLKTELNQRVNNQKRKKEHGTDEK